MSEQHPAQQPAQPPAAPQPFGSTAVPTAPRGERVGLGLLASLGSVVVGIVISVVLWRLGFIAAISSFVIAAGAAFLYTHAAGAPPRRGLAPLVVVIIAGVALSFFAVVASDLVDVYDRFATADADVSKVRFVADNLLNADVLGSYGKDMAFFAVFAVLGIFSTVRRLMTAQH